MDHHEEPKIATFKALGEQDRLFRQESFPRRFEFNEDVAKVFDNMVLRSIPMYEEVLNAAIFWASRFYQEGSTIYDLGCSTGSTIYALCSALNKNLELIGIDNSEAMLAKARLKLKPFQGPHHINFVCDDLEKIHISHASLVYMNYTLQFLPVMNRKPVLEKIYGGLNKNGVLFMSEKIRSASPLIQEMQTRTYETFKLRNGYTKSEIELKKEALDNVLIPFTPEEHLTLLKEIGFTYTEVVLRWNNFCTIVAIKA